MKRSLLEIYALVICVFTVIVFTISVGMTIKQVITVMYPGFMVVEWHDPYREEQAQERLQKDSVYMAKSLEERELDREEKRKKARENELVREVKRAKRDMVDSAIFIVLSLSLYVVHWRLAKRERRRRQEAQGAS